VYLKSLTLKGFKSFASATTLRLEPGITCVVGPNGAGKSNVVDALAWVMGEQGAKSLRGGKMEDVIFAGTSGSAGRPPLGRAEVSLTIDNSDGVLPIDYSEVTLTRTMFRSGGSEYAINGTPCRLLDVQELLSDSGIGREMHIVVGQGQLDAVLRASPEERRGFIEEAAGVLKHRKRKERALRKLDAMEASLNRVTDLTGEIRRQLGPLGRQAETARRAAVIQAEARDARLRLLADDLVQLTAVVAQEMADESALVARRTELEASIRALRDRVGQLEQDAWQAQAETARAQDRWMRLQSLRDRLETTASVAAERVRLLRQDEADETPSTGDPDDLRHQAAQVRDAEAAIHAEVEQSGTELEAAVEAREALERAVAGEQDRLTNLARAAADRREGRATLAGQVAARRSGIEAREAEIGRLRQAIEAALTRASEADQEFARLEGTIADGEAGEEGLDAAYEAAVERLHDAERGVEAAREAERTAERDRAAAQARLEALQLGLRRRDGAAALLATGDSRHGVVGSLVSLVQVRAGHEAAIAAALGWASEAVAVGSPGQAAAAIGSLREQQAGRAALLVADTARPTDPSSWPALPEYAGWARDVVTAPAGVRPALEQLLERVALVPDLAAALAVVGLGEELIAVTTDGDVFGPGFARGGSSDGQSPIEIQAAVEEASKAVSQAAHRSEQARFALASAMQVARGHAERVDAALEALNESDARMAAVAERLGHLGAAMRSARAEADRTQHALADASAALEADQRELAALLERLEQAAAQPANADEPSPEERNRLDAAATAARAVETDLRLALRTREEQARSLRDRAESLENAARHELAARERLRQRRERRLSELSVASAVRSAAAFAVGRMDEALLRAERVRAEHERARVERERNLHGVRDALATEQDELSELTDTVHRDEVARAQQLARIEQLQAKAVEELGVDPEELVADFGPHQPVPFIPGPDDDADDSGHPVPYVREEQEKRLRRAERGLSALGRVNPLALEEFAALEERHAFLTAQLEDLKHSKRDLLAIVKEVDERVQQVFAEAYEDTAAQFELVFERLFPGGEGRLVLTDPEDLLTTGIEVEARPPGKKIKRLSLLSGGERSLTAVALLVAIFKARPSPFYIMDEVEAALDDTNLGRLLTLFEELRDSSQLIVITHQKRTMEIADALYGVSMRGDGVTTVVSQRLRDIAAQPA
jgi:chromosome segregation protein